MKPKVCRRGFIRTYYISVLKHVLRTNWHKNDGVMCSGLKGRYILAQGSAMGLIVIMILALKGRGINVFYCWSASKDVE